MFKNIVFSIAFLLVSLRGLQAQELGLHFMKNVWQVNHTNPAIAPNQKIIFSFPGAYSSFSSSATSFNNMVSTNSQGLKRININQLAEGLQDQNYLKFQGTAETFNLAISVANMQFSLYHAVKANAVFRYPKALIQLASEGNAPFIGQSMDIGPEVNFLAYNEIGVGFNMRLPLLNIGGRIKALNGLGTLSTDKASLQVNTEEEFYQLNINSDYQINAAGALSMNYDGTDFDPDFDPSEYSVGDFFKINRGWGIDLGAQMDLNDKLIVAASIVDLGFISWKENAANFTSKGDFSFNGFNIDELTAEESEGESEDVFASLGDTLLTTFNFQQTENAFTTFLPSKIYLSASYKVLPIFRTGALLYVENQKGKSFKALALSGTVDLGNIFSLGAVYSIYNRTYANIGLNAQVKLGPVQLFALSDNVLAFNRPANSRGTNARFGLNLAFGKRGVTLPIIGDVD